MPRKSKSSRKPPGRGRTIPFSAAGGGNTAQSLDFWRTKTVEELAVEQGVKPVENPEELLGDFWPADESIDDFLLWLGKLRREGKEAD